MGNPFKIIDRRNCFFIYYIYEFFI